MKYLSKLWNVEFMANTEADKPLTVSWYVPSTDPDFNSQIASVWIRCLQLFPYLEKHGISCRLNMYTRVPDVAIFLRRHDLSDILLAKSLRMLGVRIVLDVVANYYEPDSSNSAGFGGCSPKARTHFLKFHDIADEVWCVSPYLTKLAYRYHSRVNFVSDSIDFMHFSMVKKKFNGEGPLRLGWSGVSVKADALNQLKPLLLEPGFELLIISDQPPVLDIPFVYRRWSYQRFPSDIIECDLCVAPRVVTTSYDRAHSIFKVGVFMAEGVPAVASEVPSYRLVLDDGAAGKLCENSEAMINDIRDCAADRGFLSSWSEVARTRMLNYSSDRIAAQIAGQLRELVGGKRHIAGSRFDGGNP